MDSAQHTQESGFLSSRPPGLAAALELVRPAPLPTTVAETWDEATQRYTYTFSLDKDERDAMVLFGTHPVMEVDGLVVRRAEAVIKAFAHQYATDCFNAKVPLDCYCERTLFRRHCAAKKGAKE